MKKKLKVGFIVFVLGMLLLAGVAAWGLRQLGTWHPLRWGHTDINVTFRESIMKITPTRGDILEVALLESEETLTRTDSKSVLDYLIYLGTTVSEIRVRVTYRYHIKLSDPWNIERRGQNLHVVAPQIYPSLPPAIHTDKMQKRSTAGWARFNANENMQRLEESLTPTLSITAITPAKITLVRDSARKAITEFVQAWVLSQPEWKDQSFDAVLVTFPDEAAQMESAPK